MVPNKRVAVKKNFLFLAVLRQGLVRGGSPGRGSAPKAASAAPRQWVGRITSIRCAEKASDTAAASVSFDVPITPSGANFSPLIGQRSPCDRPCTGPSGKSDSRVPTGKASSSDRGARKHRSTGPRIRHRRSG